MSINGTIGNVAYYNDEPIILGKSACYIVVYDSIYKEFVRFFLASEYFLGYVTNSATQTTIKNVSLKSMRNVLFRSHHLMSRSVLLKRLRNFYHIVTSLLSKLNCVRM